MSDEKSEGTSDANTFLDALSDQPPRRPYPVPDGTKCTHCGCTEVSGLPTFSVGSGLIAFPCADTVFCRRCGLLGEPAF